MRRRPAGYAHPANRNPGQGPTMIPARIPSVGRAFPSDGTERTAVAPASGTPGVRAIAQRSRYTPGQARRLRAVQDPQSGSMPSWADYLGKGAPAAGGKSS